ncbi:hypothetical protein KEJ45_06055 [Candidatus Bathyarchaeota archaeon]|nr:hypothetical protein [Candidatus Bathyarchaeota archaeon]
MMIPIPPLTSILTLFFGVLLFIIIMFMPAIIELKKPKDPGPKNIEDSESTDPFQGRLNSLDDVESEFRVDGATIKRVAEILSVLHSLEP